MRRIGEWLFNLRIKNRYTLSKSSALSGIPITMISHWEAGLIPFNKKEIDTFCILYGVNREYMTNEIQKDIDYLNKKHLKNKFS